MSPPARGGEASGGFGRLRDAPKGSGPPPKPRKPPSATVASPLGRAAQRRARSRRRRARSRRLGLPARRYPREGPEHPPKSFRSLSTFDPKSSARATLPARARRAAGSGAARPPGRPSSGSPGPRAWTARAWTRARGRAPRLSHELEHAPLPPPRPGAAGRRREPPSKRRLRAYASGQGKFELKKSL